MLLFRLNVPGPSSRYVLAGQAARSELSVAALVPAATVEPHCVHEPDGIPPGTPALPADQSIARLGAMIPDHGGVCAWAWLATIAIRNAETKNCPKRLISLP